MRRLKPPTATFTFSLLLCFAFFSIHLSRSALQFNPSILTARSKSSPIKYAIEEQTHPDFTHRTARRVRSIKDSIVSTLSVLFPDWEVLVIVSEGIQLVQVSGQKISYSCLFQNKDTSPAIVAGKLLFSNRTMFKCATPRKVRRLQPLLQPVLVTQSSEEESASIPARPQLMTWTFLAYEAISAGDEIVLLVKGINRHTVSRPPTDFRCVFGDADNPNSVRTTVTSSAQEVFRCLHPNLTAVSSGAEEERIKISLEIVTDQNLVVPSVAYYKLKQRTLANQGPKYLLCACTMVHNVAKFLKEWVMYHSKIGVEKFILYDNESDDDLETVVKELNREGYDVETLFWIWQKTQEAGFSHSVVYAKPSCTWMMYADVDEFVFSPSWHNSSQPSNHLIQSLLRRTPPKSSLSSSSSSSMKLIGQILIKCFEYGPSDQLQHPIEGVTQGYTCRRKIDNRHKSIVLLDAVDPSLQNVIHHFQVKSNFRSRQLRIGDVVVNHYKYQAWPEFRTKFRRRVSAYVVDWTKVSNPKSKDRAPGLGFQAIEPEGWPRKFCEVRDERLRFLTKRWFGTRTKNGHRMAWQR